MVHNCVIVPCQQIVGLRRKLFVCLPVVLCSLATKNEHKIQQNNYHDITSLVFLQTK